jgi:hypothetical protein
LSADADLVDRSLEFERPEVTQLAEHVAVVGELIGILDDNAGHMLKVRLAQD